MGLLDGKVALVTGGARGQGRAHALTMAREGADVILVDVAAQLGTVPYKMADVSDLETSVREVQALGRQALGITADVRSQDELDTAVASGLRTFGHIDILIANAGIWAPAAFWEMTDAHWEETIGVNLTGVWKTAKAVAPHMIERQSGSIVLISSMAGLEPGRRNSAYTSAKHGVIGLMKSIALELAPYGVRCNAICPGAVNTPMTNHPAAWALYAGHAGGTAADMLEGGYAYHALKGATFLSPQAIADTALYLNSHLAASVTGAVIPVDAGHMILSGVNQSPVR